MAFAFIQNQGNYNTVINKTIKCWAVTAAVVEISKSCVQSGKERL